MRVVFMGTPAFAVPTLSELAGQGHEIVGVYTRPPVEAGRGMKRQASPVHRLADRLGVPVHSPRGLRSPEALDVLRALDPDLVVVVAYGLILPPAILDVPRFGCLNLHASLLPRWRGAAPIQRAVMAGDPESGVAVMRMEAGLDTGPVAMERRVSLRPDMTAGDLHDLLAPIGAELMGRALAALAGGTLRFVPQLDEGVTYAQKIDKAECRIDWNRPAPEVARQVQGLSPFPGAFCAADLGGGSERIKVLRAEVLRAEVQAGDGSPGTVLDERLTVACRSGAVALTQIQRAGKGPLGVDDFLRGTRVPAGTTLAVA